MKHYIYFEEDRKRLTEVVFARNASISGAQVRYSWRTLEPKKDRYDFSSIEEDVAILQKQKKRLFVQLQETSFSPNIRLVPDYILQEPMFHGGVNSQYDIEGDDEASAKPGGWVARRWDTAVLERFHRLLGALGKAFDGKIEGINLPETSVEFGDSGRLYPSGFTPTRYREGILQNMTRLRQAFPRSVAMQYANFMPGEWLPGDNKGYLDALYAHARQLKMSMGGPDLLPYRKGQLDHAYPRLRALAQVAPNGIAVQEGNYAHQNPTTKRPVTIPELVDFAQNDLKVHYIFWCTEEPYYTQHLLPFLKGI